MLAVVITGPPGAGKTSVLTALSDAPSDDGIAHAAVEADALIRTHPPLSDEQCSRQRWFMPRWTSRRAVRRKPVTVTLGRLR